MIKELKTRLNQSPLLKNRLHYLIIQPIGCRPRSWIRPFISLFFTTKGKGAKIRCSVRKDIFPFNRFYLGSNSYIEDFTTLNNGVGDLVIGEHSRIGVGCTLIGPVTIGDHVHLAQNITVSGLNHNYADVTKTIDSQGVSMKEIVINNDVWIGANSVLTAGITVGKHSVIAAGSIVIKDVPPYSIVGGNPARVLKQYDFDAKKWIKVRKI